MADDAARITMRWAEATNPELAATLRRAKEIIPAELRYGDTFWTAVTLVGDLRNGNNHKHKDLHDIVSLIVMVGKHITGGATDDMDGFHEGSTVGEREGPGRTRRGSSMPA